jgi:predicted outer membrane protein
MRKVIIGLVVAFGVCGVCLGQNAATQQNQQPQAGQNRGGQQGQTGQPGQNQFNQQGQPGQANQFNQQGQGVGQGGQFAQRQQDGQTGQASHSDQEIAALVHGACRNEIEIAKLGQEKAQSQEVKQFAEKMVRDHSPGCEEMQKLAGSLVSSQHHQGGEAAGRQGQGQAQGQAQGGRLDWLSIHQQIADQCLNSIKQELSKKSSHDFDECFMGQQIAGHMAVVDKLKVLRNHASSDLRQKLEKELQTAEGHLQMAQQIEHKLKGESSERLSRRQNDGSK